MDPINIERPNTFFLSGFSPVLWTGILSTFVLLLLSVVVYCTKLSDQKPKKRIPGPKASPIITTLIPLISMFRNNAASNRCLLFQTICGYSYVFQKEGMWLFWGGRQPILMLFRPETVEPVLNSNDILDKGFEYDMISPWLKQGLLTSTGQKWKSRRKLLTPAFHFRILDEYIPVFNEQARVFVNKLESLMKDNSCVDIASLTSLCTLDIICETAMGKRINAQENSSSPYVQSLHVLCRTALDRIMRPWLWIDFIFYRTRNGKIFRKCLDVMEKFTREVIRDRKMEKLEALKNGEDKNVSDSTDESISRVTRKRLSLLDLLLDLHFKDSNFTLDDIAEEVDNFMFAGHDTTSSGISWTLYMLGLYPDIQKKVQEELDYVLGDDMDRQITLDDIKELKYLDCVLKEVRRLLPPTPFIARDLKEDTVINGFNIPKGTSCGILIYMLHRNSEIFPNPEIFDPDRFLLENCTGRHPFAYVPFSAGPRNCIGQRFATFEAMTVVGTLVRHFNITSMDPLDRLHIVDEVVLRSETGLRLRFLKRFPTEPSPSSQN